MSILKWQVNSFSNFASFFTVMTHNSSVNFKPVHVLLWTKGLLQSPNFETFESSGENLLNSWCHFSNHKSIFLQIFHHFSESWNIIPLYFLSPNIIYVGQKEPIWSANFGDFWVLESEFVKFPMSILKWQVNSSSFFVWFFIVMTHNSSVSFKLINVLLWTKVSHQSPNFYIFECSGENLPTSSCHFPNQKSVSLQILHHFSVSWKITSLYFFRSNIKYFAQ